MPRLSSIPSHARPSGAALVLILLAILALSSLVVLFFSLAANDRNNTGAYAQGMKADELASGGLELIVEKLREEISHPDRSTINESTPAGLGPTIYTPKQPEYILPDTTVTISSTAPSNLIKISSAARPISLLASGTTLASNASTATPSRNGRAITADRWNKPQLETFGSGTGAPIPDWIYFNRRGPVVDPTLSNASNSESAEFVTGRIAFAVYDVGGLVDINVAGYPLTFPAGESGKKGSPAFIRLQSLGIPDDAITKILSFRNPKSATDTASYLSYVQNSDAHKGFTKTVAGDNRFLSRQELVRFATQNGFADQLPLLTIFSREKNAPSYAPDPSVPAATAPPSINSSLATARHAASGRLLFEQRFPLKKIALLAELRASPSSAELAEAVKEAFGLVYDSGTRQFSYHGPGSSTRTEIKTLAQIGTEDEYRTPDFFETLKAVIYDGSVGQSPGQTATIPELDSKDCQIIRIGACIIDQYDSDYIPTAVYFDPPSPPIPIWGVENLPYVNKLQYIGQWPVFGDLFAASGGTAPNPQGGKYVFRWAVELWNPHVQSFPANTTPGPAIKVALGPSGASTRVDLCPLNTADVSDPDTVPGTATLVDAWTNTIDSGNGYASAASSPATLYRKFCDPRQVFFGAINAAPITPKPGVTYNSAYFVPEDPIYVDLHVTGTDGFVHHYYRTWKISTGLEMTKSSSLVSSYMQSDPRTNRAGMFTADWRFHSSSPPPYASYPSNTAAGSRYAWPIRISAQTDSGYSVQATGNVEFEKGYATSAIYPGLLFENAAGLATRFEDPDGTLRIGDGGFSPSSNMKVPTTPLIADVAASNPPSNENSSRPKVLDRPFNSVAEMGYVFRDGAWKTLNFSGTDSADAGLLDAFSLDATPMNAGRVSLNTRRPEVWTSVLTGSIRKDGDADAATSEESAAAFAEDFTNAMTGANSTPMRNIAEFVTRKSDPTTLTVDLFETDKLRSLKPYREAAVRSLSENMQSRTWNLMIDCVAQTGRFPRSASSLSDFIVEGERRYWLHIALDRYTGEIIDESIEAINE